MSVSKHIDAETIYALLEERLDEGAARSVECHLWRCEACRDLRAECRALLTGLESYAAEPPKPPEGYWESFWRRWDGGEEVEEAVVVPIHPHRRVGWLVAAAASIAILIGVWSLDPFGEAVGPAPQTADSNPKPVMIADSDFAGEYEMFERVSIAVGGIDPLSKGVVLASLAEEP